MCIKVSDSIDHIYFEQKEGTDTVDVHIHPDLQNGSWSLDTISVMDALFNNGYELDESSERFWGDKVREQIRKCKDIQTLQSHLWKPKSEVGKK